MPREQMRRFAVLGCGSIGKRHIKNLLALGEREIVGFDVRGDRRKEAEALGVATCASLEAVWSKQPQVAVVAVPTSLHIPLALEAARHDCHLLIEKPLSHSNDGIRELLKEAQERGLITLVGCNLRFHPALQSVKKILAGGEIGRMLSARAEFGQYLPDWHPWEDYRMGYSARAELGGGIILDAIHELDYLRWLLGEIGSVACFSGTLGGLEINAEDMAAILLRFRSGAMGEVHLDYLQRAPSRSCQVIGTDGTLRADLVTGEVRCYTVADKKWRTLPAVTGWEANQMYVDEMQHFLECLDNQQRPEQDVTAAAEILQVALAAKASQGCGKVIAVGVASAEGRR